MENKATEPKKQVMKKPFEWTATKRKVAYEIALAQEPKYVIAEKNGIHRKTIAYWEGFPKFQKRVQDLREKILVDTDERIVVGLSEQLLAMRNALHAKLTNVAELKKIPTEKLLAEYRKYMDTVFKVSKGGDMVRHHHEGEINYNGKLQIEEMLDAVESETERQVIEQTLLKMADEIVDEHAKVLESGEQVSDE